MYAIIAGVQSPTGTGSGLAPLIAYQSTVKQCVAQHRVFLATDIHGKRHATQKKSLLTGR